MDIAEASGNFDKASFQLSAELSRKNTPKSKQSLTMFHLSGLQNSYPDLAMASTALKRQADVERRMFCEQSKPLAECGESLS